MSKKRERPREQLAIEVPDGMRARLKELAERNEKTLREECLDALEAHLVGRVQAPRRRTRGEK